jgi:hypothetical protein
MITIPVVYRRRMIGKAHCHRQGTPQENILWIVDGELVAFRLSGKPGKWKYVEAAK